MAIKQPSIKVELDSLDRKILARLRLDARKPLLEIARELKVSHGTVNSRMRKMNESGVIKGSRLDFDFAKVGLTICVFIGISVTQAGQHKIVIQQLQKLHEVLEVHYTTGKYSLLIKVLLSDVQELHLFLANKLQSIAGIHSTETFIILDSPIERPIDLNR